MNFNKIDKNSSNTVMVSIVLSVFVYKNDFSYFVWAAYVVIAFMNISFIFSMVKILISGFLYKF